VTDVISTVKKTTGFDWVAAVFYPLAVILMEAFWVYPWLVWIGSWPAFSENRAALSLASVIIALAASLLVTRLTLRQKWPLGFQRAVIIGGGLVVILLVLGVDYRAGYGFLSGGWFTHIGQVLGTTFSNARTIVLALPALLYLWWRGIVLGQKTSDFRDVYRSFLLGMLSLVALIIIWQVSSASEKFSAPGPEIGLDIMAFFFFGLLAIAITHIYLMRRSMPKEEAALTTAKRWLPMMLGVVGGMILVGFGVASIFTNEFFELIGGWAGTAFNFLGKIFNYILIPLGYVFDWILRGLQFLVNLLRGTPAPGQEGGNMSAGSPWPEVTGAEIPPWVTEAVKWFVIAIIVALVIFILARAVSRLRSRRHEEIEEIHESLLSWRGLQDDLRLFFNMMGNRFKGKPPARRPYKFDESASGRLDIREIFRHVLWEGSRSGLPRRRHETASEYSRRLQHEVPESGEPLSGITGLYEDVRYGEASVPEEKVDSANSLWQTLRGLIRKMRGAGT
jgi:hypothetical protein